MPIPCLIFYLIFGYALPSGNLSNSSVVPREHGHFFGGCPHSLWYKYQGIKQAKEKKLREKSRSFIKADLSFVNSIAISIVLVAPAMKQRP